MSPASRHDAISFAHAWHLMKAFLPDYHVSKVLLDSAHDAMPFYKYFKEQGITPFIDLNSKRGRNPKYKEDFELGRDGIPICKAGLKMKHDGSEPSKNRIKFQCPMMSHGKCICEKPCSDATRGRTVHLAMKDNLRLINIPSRGSKAWKKEYNGRTSAERINKRTKEDFLLESGSHRSTKQWYCRLFCIMMCIHLDAWELPFVPALKSLVQKSA